MADDDLQIKASLDASSLIEGMKKAADTIKEQTSQITASFEEVTTVSQESSAAIGKLGEAVKASIVPTVTSFQEGTQAIDKFLTGLTGLGTEGEKTGAQLRIVSPPALQVAEAVAKMANSFQEAAIGANQLLTQLGVSTEAESKAIQAASQLEVAMYNAASSVEQMLTNFGAVSTEVARFGNVATEAGDQVAGAAANFNVTSQAAYETAGSLNSLLASLAAVGEISPAGENLSLFSDAEHLAAQTANELDQALAGLNRLVPECVALFNELMGSASGAATAIAQSAQQLELYSAKLVTIEEVLSMMADAQTGTASSASQLAASENAVGQAIEKATTSVVSMDAALAEMATAQNNAAAGVIDMEDALADMAKAQVAANDASAALTRYSVAVQEGIIPTKAMAQAIAFLNNQAAIMQASSQEVASNLEIVRNGAQRLGGQLVQTATGFQVLNQSAAGLTVGIEAVGSQSTITAGRVTGLNSALGYLTGRALATELGVSQLGFGLGILGRTLEPLNRLFLAAFPIITAVIMIETIANMTEKMTHLEDEARKTDRELSDLAISAARSADAIAIQNLKLEDQINKLENRPSQNKLKTAVAEAKLKADELIKSLTDANVKAQELLEKANTGLFESVFTGKAPTSFVSNLGSIYKELEGKQAAYTEALAIQRDAFNQLNENQTEANRKAKAEADKHVAETRAALEKEASLRLQDVEDAKKTANERIKSGIAGRGTVFGIGREPQTSSEVDAAYSRHEHTLREIISLSKNQELQEQNTAKASKIGADEAIASIKEEARERERTITEPKIKSSLDASKQEGENKKKIAEDAFKDIELQSRIEVESSIKNGTLKAKAELEASDGIIAARQKLSTKLLDIQTDEFTAERNAIAQQAQLNERTLVGDKLIVARTATKTALESLDREDTERRREIAEKERQDLANLALQRGKDEVDIQKDTNTKLIREQQARVDAERPGTQARLDEARKLFDLFKQLYKEDSTEYASAKGKMAEEDRRFQEQQRRILSDESDQRRTQQVGLLEIERANINLRHDLGLESDRDRLLSLRSTIAQEYSYELKSIEDKQKIYAKDREEFEKLEKQKTEIVSKYGKQLAEADAQIQRQRMAEILKVNKLITDDFGNAIEQMIRGQKSFLQSVLEIFGNVIITVIKDATEKMLLAWLAKLASMKIANKLFHAQDVLEHLLGISKKTAADTGETATAITQTHAKNAAIVTSDVAAENAKTLATTIGETKRWAIEQAHMQAYMAMISAELAAHTGAETTKTVVTVTNQAAQAQSDIGLASAIVFLQAIQNIPFPANVAAAPILAWSVFAQGEPFVAFAAAAKGAVLQGDQPIFAHDKEMILPSNISMGLQNMITTGDVGGNSRGDSYQLNVKMGNVQAMDGEGVASVYKRSHRALGKEIQRILKSGRINPGRF